MTTVVYPSARISANGVTALLDTVDRGVRVCDLPSGRLRWDLGEDHDLSHVSLSASGNAVAWLDENGQVTTLTEAGKTRVDLAVSRARVRAIAVSDGGDHVAALIAAVVRDAGGGSAGKLIVIPSPRLDGSGAQDDGLVEAALPVHDSGAILANDDCTLLAVRSFSRVFEQHDSRALARDVGTLTSLWTEQTAPVAHGALALYGEWLFAATADGLAGWRRSGDRVSVPGAMREEMIFSPDGGHLLAYRAEEVIEVTTERTLFRLIDLTSLGEVRRAEYLIEDRPGAQFALDAGLGLVEVRVTGTGELAVKTLEWGRP